MGRLSVVLLIVCSSMSSEPEPASVSARVAVVVAIDVVVDWPSIRTRDSVDHIAKRA